MPRKRWDALALAAVASALAVGPCVSQEVLGESEVEAAQRAWGDALVNISLTFDRQGAAAARLRAEQVIDTLYGYQFGRVLFKPTFTHGAQTFRTTRAGALSYFVGGDPAFPTDSGFALNSWRKVRIKNAAISRIGNLACTTGNAILTDKNGKVAVVDKTWQFVKVHDGTVRIVVHHSSLPYNPTPNLAVTEAEVHAAQVAWGDALVNISATYDLQGFSAAQARAEEVVNTAYCHQAGPGAVKPAFSIVNQTQTLRTTPTGALAYFLGDLAVPNDTGLALRSWERVDVRNAAVFREGDAVTSVGNVAITDRHGKVTVIDKTWRWAKGPDGRLRIVAAQNSTPSYLPAPIVTEQDVQAAQQAWGDAMVNISLTHELQGALAARVLAGKVLDSLYGFQQGPVLFAPTLNSSAPVVRTTHAGALAYFAGGSAALPTDAGFALKGWRKIVVQNDAVFRDGSTAASNGKVLLTDRDGKVTATDVTWKWRKGGDGKLRIVGQHPSPPRSPASPGTVTEAEVEAAQRAWCDGMVSIATAHDLLGEEIAKARAEHVVDTLYGYQFGPVLFKPTLAHGSKTFRTTRAGALAYFLGGDPLFPDDTGFAVKGWRSAEIRNAGVYLNGRTGTSMGKVLLTDKDGTVTAVDKTWQFLKGDDGKLRIILHHSSLPYAPTVTSTQKDASDAAAYCRPLSAALLVLWAAVRSV